MQEKVNRKISRIRIVIHMSDDRSRFPTPESAERSTKPEDQSTAVGMLCRGPAYQELTGTIERQIGSETVNHVSIELWAGSRANWSLQPRDPAREQCRNDTA